MADDFGDFADFSSAFPTTTNATTSNSAQGSELKGDGSQAVTDKVDNFFASFPSGTSSDNVNFSFGFDEQLEGLTSQGGFTNFDLTNTNIADIHIPLDLPSPPGVDVHMAGGVPFDIPPIPISPSDEEDTTPTFSKWPQTLENGAQSIVQNTSTGNTKNSAVLTLLPAATTNAASHESTVPVTGVLTGGNLKPLLNVGGDMNGSDINSTVGGLSSSTHVSGGIQDEEEFGDFESSLTFSNPKTMESVQNVGIDTTAGSSEVQLPLPDDGLKSKDDSFGSFVADTSQKTQTEGHMGFGAFESGTETSLSDTNKKEEKQAAFETSQFADFSAFKQSSEQTQQQSVGNSEFGNFEAFTNSNEMKKGDNSQFADFGNFSTFEQASVPEATEQETSGFGDFEMFSNRTENSMKSQTRSTGQAGESNIASFKSAPSLTSGVNKDVTTAGGGSEFITDFTAFHSTNNTSSTTDDFGNFSAFTGQTTASNADAEFGDFSGAEDSKSNTAGNISGGSKDDFGDFSSNDDFGDFSTSAFGNFSNVPAALTSVQPESSGAVKTMKVRNIILLSWSLCDPVMPAVFTASVLRVCRQM